MAQTNSKSKNEKDAGFARGKVELDNLDAIIIKELLTTPDVNPIDIASRHARPISTIRRRLAKLQERLVKKKYVIDYQSLGLRTAFLTMDVHKGNVQQVISELAKHPKMVCIRHGINSHISIMAEITFEDSQELLSILSFAKSIQNVSNVGFFEIIGEFTTNNHSRNLPPTKGQIQSSEKSKRSKKFVNLPKYQQRNN